MKNILIAVLTISVGFNIYLSVQDGAKPSQMQETAEHSGLGIFQREGDAWIFYSVKENGAKTATGLRVLVQTNSNVPGWPEEIYAALSPDGRKVAYMQKPAWPHQIYIANIDGTNVIESIEWSADFAPTHANVENNFIWAPDSQSLTYAITNEECGPADSGRTFETTMVNKNLISKNEEMVLRLEHSCDEFSIGAKAIPVD